MSSKPPSPRKAPDLPLPPTPAVSAATISTAADRLRTLIKDYETRDPNPSPALLRAAHAALDDVDSYRRTVGGLSDNATNTVDDRLVRSLRTSFRDAVGRADTALRREWDRLVNLLVDEVRFVFESGSTDDDAGEQAVENCRQALQKISQSVDLVGELDGLINNFVENRFRQGARDMYSSMINSASAATQRTLDARLQGVIKKLEPAAPQSVPPRPQTPVQRVASPAQAVAPPAVASRAQPDNSTHRPQSGADAEPPAQPPPATKPRPKSVVVPVGPVPAARPPPIERSPIAKNRMSVTDMPAPEPEMRDEEDSDASPTKAGPEGGRSGLVANLNRMLSGPPPTFKRPSVEYVAEDEDAGDDDIVPHAPTSPVVHEPEQMEHHNTTEDYVPEKPHSPQPVAARHPHPPQPVMAQQPPPAVPARAPTSNALPEHDLHAPSNNITPSGSDSNIAASSDKKEKEKENHKHKGQKSPKMGFRGMLSHLTKSRPKKGKKGKEDEAHEQEEFGVEALEEPVAPHDEESAPVMEPVPLPPKPAPRPPVDDDHVRGHGKETSTSSARSRPTHSRPGSVAGSLPTEDQMNPEPLSHPHEEYPPAENAPVVPARPPKKPPQNAAMGALANVMRGAASVRDETGESDETASTGSRNRMSMYSDSGASAGRPSSTYSESGPESELHPPRPPRPTSVLNPATPPRRNTGDDTQQGPTSPTGVEPPVPMPVPRRPPKPVASSPARKSMMSDDGVSGSPPPGNVPVIPPKPGVRKSMGLDDGAADSISPGQQQQASPPVPAPVPRPRPPPGAQSYDRPASGVTVGSERPTSGYSERPVSNYSSGERPVSNYSAGEVGTPTEETPAEEILDQHPQEESPKPKRIPGVFATSHGALGALAAAVTGRGPGRLGRTLSQESVDDSGQARDGDEGPPGDEVLPPPVVGSAEGDVVQDHPTTTTSPPPRRLPPGARAISNHDLFTGPALNLKRKESSVSGDDKAIEKGGLEWMNKHLSSRGIVVDDLFSSVGDGLNLIYALEDATNESIGKYNKRIIMNVQKIDNLAVALSFLGRKGVEVRFCTPQDLVNGDKGKILTLFVNVLKVWPL